MERPPSPRSIATLHRMYLRPLPGSSDDDDDDDTLSEDDAAWLNAGFRWCVVRLPTAKAEAAFERFLSRRVFYVMMSLQLMTRIVELYGAVDTGLDTTAGRAFAAVVFGVMASAMVGAPAWVESALLDHPFAFVSGTKFVNHIVRCVGIASHGTARVAPSENSMSFLFCVPLVNGMMMPLLGGGLFGQLVVLGTDAVLMPRVARYAGIGDAVPVLLATWVVGLALGNLFIFVMLKPIWEFTMRSRAKQRRLRRQISALEPLVAARVAAHRNMAN